MSVTPTGPLSVALDALRTLVANVPFFQTWTGTANAIDAAKRVFVGEVGYPLAAVSIAGGVMTVQTRDIHGITVGSAVTIEGAATGAESIRDIDDAYTVLSVTANSFTVATALEDLATVYLDQVFVLECVRPIIVICETQEGVRGTRISQGGGSVYSGGIDLLLEADTPAEFGNAPINALTDARNAVGAFIQSLMETQDTGDFMVLNESAISAGPEFANRSEQNQNAVRFERWRAVIRVQWGISA